MERITKIIIWSMFMIGLVLLGIVNAGAISVNQIGNVRIAPGEEAQVIVEVKNTLDHDITNVVLSIDLSSGSGLGNLPFIALSGSSDSVDKIKDGDEEDFIFRLKASANAVVGDYSVPYTLQYFDSETDEREMQRGTIGVTIEAEPEFDVDISVDRPVIGENAIVTLKIINNGLADARFVSVDARERGYTILSDKKQYIGTIDSDDFETVSFDVKFTSSRPRFIATVTYRDFNNNEKSFEVDESLNLYSRERAIELGIIDQSNTFFYVIGVIALVVIIFIWRYIARRRRARKSMMRDRA